MESAITENSGIFVIRLAFLKLEAPARHVLVKSLVCFHFS